MSLLCTDGFDKQDFVDKWVAGFGTFTSITGTPRFGASGYSVSQSMGSTAYSFRSFGEKATVIVGFAFKMSASNSTGFSLPICALWGDARTTEHLQLGVVNSTNKLEVRRGNWTGTVLGTSATETIPINTWCHIQMKATLHDSTGSVEVKLNGTTVINVTGVDTKNAGTLTTFSSLMIGSNANFGTNTFSWDDSWICDTVDGTTLTPSQGAAFDTFLGDQRVRTLHPSGAGSSTQFTPLSGSNYDNTNDVPPNYSTYNASGTTGHRDTYAMDDASIASGDSVLAVVVNNWLQRDNTGAINGKGALKSGSTVGYGPTVALGTTKALQQDVFAKDPNTSAAWVNAAIDSVEAGAEVAA